MKPKKIHYQIEEPCHADWDQMKPEAQGRFCSSCSKTVVDFSAMSDFSIVNYLENNKHQSVCGRFTEAQLDKTYLWTKPHPTLFQFDLKAVALGLALSTFSAIPAQSQNTPITEQHDSTETMVVKQGEVAVFYDHRDEKFVSGNIQLDDKKFGDIKIVLIDGNAAELSSVVIRPDNGKFRIPLDWTKNPVAIKVSSDGYNTQTVYFENHQSLSGLKVVLYEKHPVKMGKVMRKDD
ncbi:hypothetical protein [Fluviicola sp.]|uniref:hypothetical protein n=1 Tax=Fluviicola sp. TaxID=1917219 RepID=UPI0031E26693